MTHERDLERERHGDTTSHKDTRVPGRASASSALVAGAGAVPSGIVQRKPRDTNGVEADAGSAVAAAASSSGSQLPETLQRKFEGSLGADLSSVRVHTGEASAEAARSVGARAYTTGQDIHFGAGEYDPASAAGEQLIAHEVAHTVQQRGAPARQHKDLVVSSPHDPAEHEADAAASAMVAGESFAISSAPSEVAREKKKKDDKKDDKKEKPKFPKFVGDKKTMELPFGAGKLELDMSENNPGVSVGFKKDLEVEFFKIDHTVEPPPMLAPGVPVDLNVNAGAGIKVTGSGKGSAKWEDAPGPRTEPEQQFVMSAGGGGSVGLDLHGGVKIGAGPGVPMFRLAGGAELGLAAKSSIGADLKASVTRNPDGFFSGQVDLTVAGEAKIEGTGGLYVDVVIASDRYSLFTYELATLPIAVAKVKCVAAVDLESGKPMDVPPEVTFEWLNPTAKLVTTRKLTEKERAALLPVNQGASGAPPALPDGEVELRPGEDPDGGGGAGGAPG